MDDPKTNFIPANMPGCQMMSNLNYVPASQPESGRWHMTYTPATSQHIINAPHLGLATYIPCSSSAAPGPNGVSQSSSTYIPASTCTGAPGPAGSDCIGKLNEASFKLSWWESNSFFRYPFMLISAFYGMKWRDDFRSHFNIPDDFIIIGDSGGFQNMTQDANLNIIDVLRWQEKHCQIGLTFDEPIFKDDDRETKTKKQINTVSNAYLALNNRRSPDLKLYAIIQGHNPEEQKFIFDEYQKQGDPTKFDGFAIGGLVPIAGNTRMVTQVLVNFLENIKDFKKPVHFFGISGLNIVPIIIYLQKLYDIPITFDSSSYGAGAMRKEYWLENSKTKVSFSEGGNDLTALPCDCPVCSISTPQSYFDSGSLSGGMISLHNLFTTIRYTELLKIISKDPEIFKNYVAKNCSDEVTTMLEMIDYIKENGLSKGLMMYPFERTETKQKSANLFGF